MYGAYGPWPTGGPGDLSHTLLDRAVATWQQLDWGHRFSLLPGEETLTDNNLLDIQIRHQTRVRTWKLDRRSERELGADWEWWFGGRDGWFGLRLQAKKLFPHSGRYSSLKREQAAELVRRSAPGGLAAFYCFYNSSWPMRSGRPSVGACCSRQRHQEAFGCTLVPAFEVYNRVYAGQTRLDDYEPVSVPWQCLLGCPRFRHRGPSLPRRVRSAAADLNPFGSYAFAGRPLRERPPEYVGNVLAGEDPTSSLLRYETQGQGFEGQNAGASSVQLRYVSVVRDPELGDVPDERAGDDRGG